MLRETLVLAAITSLWMAAPAYANSPASAVANFYHWSLTTASGAPAPAAQAELRPLVTSELHCLLTAAWKVMESYKVTHPGDKPPYVEGDLYSSMFEGPTAFTVQSVLLSGKTQAIGGVRLRYKDKQNSHIWGDTVHLRLEMGHWRVADIERKDGETGRANPLLKSLHTDLEMLDPEAALRGPGKCRPGAG